MKTVALGKGAKLSTASCSSAKKAAVAKDMGHLVTNFAKKVVGKDFPGVAIRITRCGVNSCLADAGDISQGSL